VALYQINILLYTRSKMS